MTTLPQLAFKLERVAKELTDAKLLQAVGMEGKRLGTDSIKADTGGDARMSNWRRGRPINLATRFDLVGESAVEIAPAKRARGPVRVLNEGRKAGTSRRGRPVSASSGGGTWDRASQSMTTELPKVAARHTTQVLRKHF
jgi:hypothetical protein